MTQAPVEVQFGSQTVSFTSESASSIIKLALSLLAVNSYADDVDGEISDSVLELLSIEFGNAGLDLPVMVQRIHGEWDQDARQAQENRQAGPLVMLPTTQQGIFIGVPVADLQPDAA